MNVPLPLPMRIVTVLATSVGHGEVHPPVTGEVAGDDRIGAPGTGIGGRLSNVPLPLPRKMATSLRPGSATARSVRPSPLKSAATIAVARSRRQGDGQRLLERAVAVAWQDRDGVGARLMTARPRLPLPVKSPVATAAVSVPTGLAVVSWKVPSPLPSNTEISLGAVVSRRQVEPAVAVEIARDDIYRGRSPAKSAAA